MAKKYDMNKILTARATIGDGYEKARAMKDPSDKLTILKMAYYLATQVVPDPTRHEPKLRLIDVDKYQEQLLQMENKNNDKNHPNKVLHQRLQKRWSDLIAFRQHSVNNYKHSYYFDNLMVVDKNWNPMYPHAEDFGYYITSYNNFLQSEYKKNRTKFNFD